MNPWLDDGDLRLYHGDALEVVRQLPDESVDCVVTSPPYWGLRDYGTGEWDGGDPNCDHTVELGDGGSGEPAEGYASPFRAGKQYTHQKVAGNECRCGARRVDRQMGLEPAPDLFVQGMVELFREIRRVLAPHGTCWVNLGDSYAQSGGKLDPEPLEVLQERAQRKGYDVGAWGAKTKDGQGIAGRAANTAVGGLKPKDLCGIPWRVAFALQADGWWLRSDIIWAKPNPMPESVTDRPTKAHEYIFLLTKQPRYWFDSEAIREPHTVAHIQKQNSPPKDRGDQRGFAKQGLHDFVNPNGRNSRTVWEVEDTELHIEERSTDGGRMGRPRRPRADDQDRPGSNARSVWQIATQPYPEAHFATYPEELARRCILAGCPVRVCRVCGKPSERIVDTSYEKSPVHGAGSVVGRHYETGANNFDGAGMPRLNKVTETVGWSDCGHNQWRPGTVLDPFIGSGTTAKAARDHQRHAIGIDLNQEYLELAARRLQQLSLLT